MMDESQALEIAARAIDLAGNAGADAAEATVSIARRFHVEARESVISKLEQSTAKSLHVRVFAGGRKASLTTSDLSSDGLREAVRRTLDQAAYVASDDLAGLPDEFAASPPALDLYDARVAEREGDEKVEEALALEKLIRRDDPRVANSAGSHYTDAVSIAAIVNSAGFAAAYSSTRAGRSTGPVADDGTVKRTAHYGTAARHFDELESLEDVARTAVSRAVGLFGAKKPATMRVPVIFERDVASSILDDVFAALSAANVAAGNSWLIGRIGSKVGSRFVTIVDDGLLAFAAKRIPDELAQHWVHRFARLTVDEHVDRPAQGILLRRHVFERRGDGRPTWMHDELQHLGARIGIPGQSGVTDGVLVRRHFI